MWTYLGMLCGGYAWYVVASSLSGRWSRFPPDVSSLAGWVMILAVIVGFAMNRRRTAEALAWIDDPRLTPALVEVVLGGRQGYMAYDRRTRDLGREALMRLLPRLKASDAALLDERVRARLRSVLVMDGYIAFGRRHPAALMVAIIRGLGEIGDAASLTRFEALAKSSRYAAVREAASEWLPALTAAAEADRRRGTLVSPAGAPSEPAAALLRPAQGGVSDAADTLVRPHLPAPEGPAS